MSLAELFIVDNLLNVFLVLFPDVVVIITIIIITATINYKLLKIVTFYNFTRWLLSLFAIS